jgi:hypothetical protein
MRSALALAVAGLLVGCASSPPRTSERRADLREERQDDRRDTRIEATTGWNKLGEKWVDGTNDRDVVWVGEQAGTYRKVRFDVQHSAVEMYDVIITFGDGETFSPPTRFRFGEDSRTSVIDLPGRERIIKKIEFRYGNLPGGGRAQVEAWAR